MDNSLGKKKGTLYSNVTLRAMQADPADGTVRLKVSYDEREYQSILYSGVFYNQFEQSAIGEMITLAEELSPQELLPQQTRKSVMQFWEDCNYTDHAFLNDMVRRGNRVFLHYMGKGKEYIIIAKEILIEGAVP